MHIVNSKSSTSRWKGMLLDWPTTDQLVLQSAGYCWLVDELMAGQVKIGVPYSENKG